MPVSLLQFASWGLAMATVVATALLLLFGPLFGERITDALQNACIRAGQPTSYCSDQP